MTIIDSYAIILSELAEANAHFYKKRKKMDLYSAKELTEYKVAALNTDDGELNSFLFTLGCYPGEPITVIKRRKSGCVLAIKDARYSFDRRLCEKITVEK